MLLIESSAVLGSTKMQLIFDKIALPSPLDGISRPRLLAFLAKSLTTCNSTIICGRSGTGKTFLATQFAQCCGRSVAWFKVDTTDIELPIFFHYLVSSLEAHFPGNGFKSLMPLAASVTRDHTSVLAEGLVYELLQHEIKPLLLVIEDLHLVCDSDWVVPFFRRLLPLLPSYMHILITSRTMPPAPLWRMRSKQTLAVLEEETLAFTKTEAFKLFETYGLTSEHAGIALDHTHGRAAALDSFAAALKRSKRESVFSVT